MTVPASRYADSGDHACALTPPRDRGRDHQVLRELRNHPHRPVLVSGGTVLSQDPAIGDLPTGDVLIRYGRITAVGDDLSAQATDAIVVDASDAIVIPGFVDAHVHAWEGQLRGSAPVLDFPGYLDFTAFGFGPCYRPHDNYVGTLLTALVALDAGITTIVDNSHNSHTPDHSNAAVEALFDSGIRGVHASGAPVGGGAEGWLADIPRLREQYFGSEDQLVTLRLFDLYPSVELWQFAADQELWMSHEMGAHIDSVGEVLGQLHTLGLLTDRHSFNHCFGLPDSAWELIADSGAAVNVCPRSDAAFGLGPGFPPLDTIRRHGLLPGLSGDNEISYGLSMFAEMQALLNGHRGRVFRDANAGVDEVPEHLAPADVLEYATRGGAANAGLSSRIGSLTPGKDADLTLIRTTDVNTSPLANAWATVTAFAHPGNVDTVFVGGRVRKFRGELVDHDLVAVRQLVEASRNYLLTANSRHPDVLAERGSQPLP